MITLDRVAQVINQILHGDALTKLKDLESESIDCCITSPPYWVLRDYKTEGQLGLESTFNEYITKLVQILGEIKRVLKKTGSCWVNMGDTYGGSGKGSGKGIPEKSLCLIPERFAISMVDQGWILRNKIIWFKPNSMPSSIKDRFTVDWEYLFFFVKSPRYYFETQYEPLESLESPSWQMVRIKGLPAPVGCRFGGKKALQGDGYNNSTHSGKTYSGKEWTPSPYGRIKRAVWRISTKPFSEAHFATFPPELVLTPLKATCPPEGVVLDPFMGAGTTALVALQNARNFIGIELNKSYIDMAMKRIAPYLQQTRLD